MEHQKMLKIVSLCLELFKYILDSTSVWFKLNNPVHKEKNSFVASPLKMKVLSFEILGTTDLKLNHIPEDLMAPWGGIHKGILHKAFYTYFKSIFCTSSKEVTESSVTPEIFASGFKACRFYPVSWITDMRVSFTLSLWMSIYRKVGNKVNSKFCC